MSNAAKLNWGILATGSIANAFARGVAASRTGQVLAVASRSQANADKFADTHQIARRYGRYEDLLADKDVQAVYIATPHTQHPEWAIKAIRAGKHVLCEKPIALNRALAEVVIEEARERGVLLMEAFMYRCHPQIARVIELLRQGAIGELRVINASFGFGGGTAPVNAKSRLFDAEFGGGGILDVGCYPVSASRLFAGAAAGKPFLDPVNVVAAGKLGVTNVDEWAAGVLTFENGVIAQVATGIRATLENNVRLIGSDGSIVIHNPWTPSRDGSGTTITVTSQGKSQDIEIVPDVPLYALEADTFANTLPATQATSPAMSWDDTLGNMRTLDQWRQAIGLVYPAETPQGSGVIHGGALARRDGQVMQYGRIAGLDKDISRFIMGCDNQPSYGNAAPLYDAWFEQGGNAFDTAYIYGGGKHETILGQWINARNVREQVVVITKGAHTPNCFPDKLTSQLLESLERQQTGYADLYIMHRDNLDVPVGEFVDVLDEHVRAGRIRAFGGSNWTLARIEAANAYAQANGKQGFSLVSNNFSLAQMMDHIWAGCVAASDAASRAWLEQRQFPVLSWSSQARGFFTDRAGPDKHDDAELTRCWYSPANFARRQRAIELAGKKGVLPINIAAAYVLQQPFPTFALIGPRTLRELLTSLPGLTVTLTPDEVRWLRGED